MADSDPAQPQQSRYRGLVPFQPGQSGNPKGRSVGSRNKLGEAFISDLLADWEKNGAAAIVKVRDEKPDQYLKVVASILPKELIVTVNEYDELTDDELDARFAAIASQLGYGGRADRDRASAPRDAEAGAAKPH